MVTLVCNSQQVWGPGYDCRLQLSGGLATLGWLGVVEDMQVDAGAIVSRPVSDSHAPCSELVGSSSRGGFQVLEARR